MIFKEIDNMKDVGAICHYFPSRYNLPDRRSIHRRMNHLERCICHLHIYLH